VWSSNQSQLLLMLDFCGVGSRAAHTPAKEAIAAFLLGL
jgi:hypothetical protein